ncbi:hypothetical protein T440DRAFT_516518 [Plenodomus tracheiphilus IPT5]|uniref:Uncharacterized protein n=1 Tax=Plenodomus tracheiphilus IPT5 TaxID=1408161 RepID=A0A6A7BB96_9PLEO|nr:hypothetical protein T440DRAFT_516518 [Plenodomus tracheiphilus IPT5]
MATSGDPTKRPPPLELQQELPPEDALDLSGDADSMAAADDESDYRRQTRSSTYGQIAWDLPAERQEPGGHRRRMSEFIDRLIGSAPNSPHKARRSSTFSMVPQHSDDSVRNEQPVDEPSVLGIIEQRQEQRAGLVQSSSVYDPVPIVRYDLRQECRDAASAKQGGKKKALPRSLSAKKLLNKGLMKGKDTAISTLSALGVRRELTPPPMPTKAAEVLGATPRVYRQIQVRRIEPSDFHESFEEHAPPRASRESYPDTAALLPAKVFSTDTVGRSHHDGVGRRDRAVSRRSSWESTASQVSRATGKGKGKAIVIDTKVAEKEPVSPNPPTPPKKDTPPHQSQAVRSGSPLRRMSQAHDLRGFSDSSREAPVKKQFTLFSKHFTRAKSQRQIEAEAEAAEDDGVPIKTGAYNSEDMTALIEGRAMGWPLTDKDQGHLHGQSESDNQPGLPPRFYSPAELSARSFAPGESPSTNTDPNRMLFRRTATAHPPNLSNKSSDSKEGSIGVMFQGSPEEIDRGSSTARMLVERESAPAATRDDTITTRVLSELRLSDYQPDTAASRSVVDQPSSRLTAMLHEAGARIQGWDRSFQPNCPSALPSPLHHMAGALTPGQSAMASPSQFGPLNPRTPRNMDEHFWMTNEHLDVVGKTTWDILAMANQETLAAIGTNHAKLMTLVEKHFEDLKIHLKTLDDKAGRGAEEIAKVHQDLEKIQSLYSTGIANAFAAQDKKYTQMEGQLKEMQASIQAMQKSLEQNINESKSGQQQSATNPVNTPNSVHSPYPLPIHRSQTALGGYYGPTNGTREGQPQVPDNMHAASPLDPSNATQTGYDTGYGQQWGSRAGYPVRGSSREARPPYSGANPYQFATGGPFNGGYPGGYSHNFPPSPSDAAFGFGPGQAK